MINPDEFSRHLLIPAALVLALLLSACGTSVVSKTGVESGTKDPAKAVVASLPYWLGNPQRNFYGSGPWAPGPLEIVWEFKTDSISGRLHPDPWGGTSWPGQPSVDGNRVYFPSADGNVYCINTEDGSVIWKFKAKDSFKATPTVVGDRIIASGLDHHIYCLSKSDGALLWDFETGFEVDGSAAVIDGRIYFGSEDGFFYCLNLADGSLVYKTGRLGSMEGSCTAVDGKIYVGTEQGDLYCLNQTDGATMCVGVENIALSDVVVFGVLRTVVWPGRKQLICWS